MLFHSYFKVDSPNAENSRCYKMHYASHYAGGNFSGPFIKADARKKPKPHNAENKAMQTIRTVLDVVKRRKLLLCSKQQVQLFSIVQLTH